MPRKAAQRRLRYDHGEPIRGIDIRPMVFVALFVAILFLIPASQTRTHALLVDLPIGIAPPDYAPAYLVVNIAENGEISLDDVPVMLDDLSQAIIAKQGSWPIVLLRADADTAYETVALVLSKISSAGVAPTDICFDPQQLEAHRRFEKIGFRPVYTLVEPEPLSESDIHLSLDLTPGGCEQFMIPIPLT